MYYNTPIATISLIIGWLSDFIFTAKTVYLDIVTRFFDYIIDAAENGLKSVPKHPKNIVEYPVEGFHDKFKDIFRKFQDLPPKTDSSSGDMPHRWYDSLRDKTYFTDEELDKIRNQKPINAPDTQLGNSVLSNTFNFLKDNWQFFAFWGGVLAIGTTVILFWEPISSGVSTIGNSIGTSIKTGYNNFMGYFWSTGGQAPEGPIGDQTPNMARGDVADDPNALPLETMTPRNTRGPEPLADEDITQRALSLRFPDSPVHKPWADAVSLNSSNGNIQGPLTEHSARMMAAAEYFADAAKGKPVGPYIPGSDNMTIQDLAMSRPGFSTTSAIASGSGTVPGTATVTGTGTAYYPSIRINPSFNPLHPLGPLAPSVEGSMSGSGSGSSSSSTSVLGLANMPPVAENATVTTENVQNSPILSQVDLNAFNRNN